MLHSRPARETAAREILEIAFYARRQESTKDQHVYGRPCLERAVDELTSTIWHDTVAQSHDWLQRDLGEEIDLPKMLDVIFVL